MSYIFALFQKVSDLFASPHLPLDSDYSYEARSREAERVRSAQATLFGIKLTRLSKPRSTSPSADQRARGRARSMRIERLRPLFAKRVPWLFFFGPAGSASPSSEIFLSQK